MPVSHLVNSTINIAEVLPLKWTNGPVHLLGITTTALPGDLYQLNFPKMIEKIK
jgi:hypothetical protein